MIESIQLKNFRGIQGGRIDRFSKFNLLVGPNNSGKTAILESLYLSGTSSRVASLGDSYKVKVADEDMLGCNPLERVLNKHSIQNTRPKLPYGSLQVSLESTSAPFKQYPLHIIEGRAKEGTSVATFSMAASDNLNLSPEQKKSFTELRKGIFGKPECEEFDIGVYCWEFPLTYQGVGSAMWLLNGKLPTAQHTLFYDVSNTLNHLPMDFFRRTITTVPGWAQKIARLFGRALGLNKPFNVQFLPADETQQWMQGWIAPEDRIALTIDSYGDGARSVFKVLTPLLALAESVSKKSSGLFIWEEPELFQNPQTLGKLLTEMATLLRGKPIQVFIATHSLEVVAHFVRLVREEIIGENELLAIRLNLDDGQLSSSAFNHQDIQDWTEMHLDLRVPSGKVDSPLTYQMPETVNVSE